MVAVVVSPVGLGTTFAQESQGGQGRSARLAGLRTLLPVSVSRSPHSPTAHEPRAISCGALVWPPCPVGLLYAHVTLLHRRTGCYVLPGGGEPTLLRPL